ncbi:hypothetical protein E6C27_scaffold1639G00660 [Cucumis melo var. makuwa]|uniref:Uncharacterized protein n=1 Tax=Cucumis melo var. makuwa TaxID=1194695 RepID=A0A5A7TQG8_CUCMM|nr:hypothetical protein E6C27_scaffold1639G00660 [Cucumis melo var. makuwa]
MTLDGISGNSRDTGESESQVSEGRISKSGRVVRKMWRDAVGYPSVCRCTAVERKMWMRRWWSATPRSKNVNVVRCCWISQVTRMILERANLRSAKGDFQVLERHCGIEAKLRREDRVSVYMARWPWKLVLLLRSLLESTLLLSAMARLRRQASAIPSGEGSVTFTPLGILYKEQRYWQKARKKTSKDALRENC